MLTPNMFQAFLIDDFLMQYEKPESRFYNPWRGVTMVQTTLLLSLPIDSCLQ